MTTFKVKTPEPKAFLRLPERFHHEERRGDLAGCRKVLTEAARTKHQSGTHNTALPIGYDYDCTH
jgi:hypothetical protein